LIVEYSSRFKRLLAKAPQDVRSAFQKQVGFLLADLRHPSLRAKKFSERLDMWQARVNKDWRFYFEIDGEVYRLISIRSHPK
jgi:hypothetical protein